LGKGCFIGFGSVVFDASLGEGVFVGAGSVVQGVNLPANVFVPPHASILSKEQAAPLRTTRPAEQRFMEKVIAANLILTKGYVNLESKEINTCGQRS
jgi:carbonic anhydrase/acetyltransferase-like protein (isoleucine patch superfamily)